MRRLAFIPIVAVFLMFCAVPVNAATVGLNINQNNFGAGDNISTAVSVFNSGNPVTIDAYLALMFPNGSLVFFESSNGSLPLVPKRGTTAPATWTKLVSHETLPSTLDFGPLPVFNYALTGSEQPGMYQWVFGLAEAGTLSELAINHAPFFVSPSPVGTRLGTWSITKSLPSLGGSGTGLAKVMDSSPGILTLSGNSFSAGLTSSYSYTGFLVPQGGITWEMQGDIFGTQVQGSGVIDPGGNISGIINVTTVGPYIQSITHITGTLSGNVINASYTVTYTNGSSGTEFLTAIRQ